MIFLDGVGIGEKDPAKNPFFKRPFRFMVDIFGDTPHLESQYLEADNKFLFPVDACMGIEDLPQSGTGQTSIFTGIDASEKIGMHFGPYPYSTLLPVIKEHNIFRAFLRKKLKVLK